MLSISGEWQELIKAMGRIFDTIVFHNFVCVEGRRDNEAIMAPAVVEEHSQYKVSI